MPDQVQHVLEAMGRKPEEVDLGDCGRAMVLPHGGRILGLYSSESSDENFLWTNPALNSFETAQAYFARDAWLNSGGDRTWLAPEAELFISDLGRAWDTYRVPSELDPGQYVRFQDEHGHVAFRNRLRVTLFTSRATAEVEIARAIWSAANPMRHEPEVCDGVEYAGYTLRSSLNILASDAGNRHIAIGLWNLLQLPHGGELLVPTYGRAQIDTLFGQLNERDIAAQDGLLRYRMQADGIQKIGLRAPAVTGRAAYVCRGNRERASLIVRNFAVNPSAEYVDTRWNQLDSGKGYCFQACNVADDGLGRFSEVEHHAPAAVSGESHRSSCSDISQTWAFRGPTGAIRRILHRLIGAGL